MSGAWKTWVSLISYAYTNEMSFAPLPTSIHESGPALDTGVQRPQSCSPRSMYSLATVLGIKNIRGYALKSIQSELSTSNITRELFSSFAASHREVLDMEIRFLHERFTQRDPKFLVDYAQRVASGEATFFPATLGLVYDELVEGTFRKHTSSSSGLAGGQSVTTPQASTSTSSVTSSSTSSSANSEASFSDSPAPQIRVLSNSTIKRVGLKCVRRWCTAPVNSLYDGLHCPRCPDTGRNGRGQRGRPFMQCVGCNTLRVRRGNVCLKCGGQFE